MDVANAAISRGILLGLARTGAITAEQFEDVADQLWQAAASIRGKTPSAADSVEAFIDEVRSELGLDPQPRPPRLDP